jgi:3'-phosphoadenosine 5'-phosphosulfate (PAPS) 3'-phosphatase
MTDSTSDILIVAQRAARAAAEVFPQHFGHADVREKGGSQNVVTQADLESEELITRMVLEASPDHTLLREETAFEGDMEAERSSPGDFNTTEGRQWNAHWMRFARCFAPTSAACGAWAPPHSTCPGWPAAALVVF